MCFGKKVSVLVVFWIVSIAAIAAFVWFEVWFFKSLYDRHFSQKKAPTFTAPVTVFSKAMSNGHYGSSYFIAFSFPDGTRKNIPVTVEEYNTIGEGETGILTYQQDAKYIWFVSFQRTV